MEEIEFFIKNFKWGLLAGLCFSLSTSFTSPFLVLQRNSLFPHALTHILLLSLTILALLTPFLPSLFHFPFLLLITLILTSLIYLLIKFLKFFEDTATSFITYLAMSLALIIATKTSQYDLTLLNYLFGSLFTVDFQNFIESLIVFGLSLLGYLLYKDFWITGSLEKEVPGLNFQRAQLVLLLLITLQTTVGVRLLGILLVPAVFVFASTLALSLALNFKWVLPLTLFFNFLGILGGLFFSIFFDLPFSASTIIFMGSYLIFIIIKKR